MARLSSQRGMAVPAALWVIVILLGFALAASGVALAGLSQANRDRHSKRALAAGDAGVDAALYRMNQAVVSGDLTGLLGVSGLTSAALRELGCVDASLASVSLIDTSQTNWCAAQTGNSEELGDTAKYTYWVRNGVNVPIASLPANIRNLLTGGTTSVVRRSIVSVGESSGIKRRVLGVFLLSLNTSSASIALWKQVAFVECPVIYSGAPDSGCPSPGV